MTTRTTNHLHISPIDRALLWWHRADKVAVCGVLTIGLVIVLASARSWRSEPHSAPQTMATPMLPIILIATPVPTPAAVVRAASGPTLARAVVAYDAPEGNALGAIEQGRAYKVLARWGSDWLQADVVGSGVVWLKSNDVLDLPPDLADLQPPPAPVVVERPIYVSAPEIAVATPKPEQYQVMSAPLTERERNIQNRLVDPQAAQEWAAQQWRDEHCVGDRCIP